jgi:hypothetical protein
LAALIGEAPWKLLIIVTCGMDYRRSGRADLGLAGALDVHHGTEQQPGARTPSGTPPTAVTESSAVVADDAAGQSPEKHTGGGGGR